MYVQDSWKNEDQIFTFNYGLANELPGAPGREERQRKHFVPGVGMMKLNSNLRIDVESHHCGPKRHFTLTPSIPFCPALDSSECQTESRLLLHGVVAENPAGPIRGRQDGHSLGLPPEL